MLQPVATHWLRKLGIAANSTCHVMTMLGRSMAAKGKTRTYYTSHIFAQGEFWHASVTTAFISSCLLCGVFGRLYWRMQASRQHSYVAACFVGCLEDCTGNQRRRSPWWWKYKHFCRAIGRHCSIALFNKLVTVSLRKDSVTTGRSNYI